MLDSVRAVSTGRLRLKRTRMHSNKYNIHKFCSCIMQAFAQSVLRLAFFIAPNSHAAGACDESRRHYSRFNQMQHNIKILTFNIYHFHYRRLRQSKENAKGTPLTAASWGRPRAAQIKTERHLRRKSHNKRFVVTCLNNAMLLSVVLQLRFSSYIPLLGAELANLALHTGRRLLVWCAWEASFLSFLSKEVAPLSYVGDGLQKCIPLLWSRFSS